MTVHIQVVGFNHRGYLAACLRSCLQQTLGVPVLYVDNASADGSVDFVRREFPDVRVRANSENRGYSGGHHDGLREISDTNVVIVLNPDVVLELDFVEQGLAAFTHVRVAAVVPLLLRNVEPGTLNKGPAVDAYGIRLLPSLRAVNNLEGCSVPSSELGVERWSKPWGFTGAAVFLRREALSDVALGGEIFDEDLFSYREDVDLSWRLRHRGWGIVGAPEARATHVRAIRAGATKPGRIRQLSWRNYYLTIVKNVPGSVLRRHLPWVLAEDLARDLQWLVTPALWSALPELARLLPRFLRKRRQVLTRALPRFPDGRVNYRTLETVPVVTCLVRREGKVLLLKRSDRVSTYPGYWHTVAGYLDEPDLALRGHVAKELLEELGLGEENWRLVRVAPPLTVADESVGKTWIIHPVLVELVDDPPLRLDWEHTAYRWVRPDEITQYQTIPSLSDVLRSLTYRRFNLYYGG